MDLSSLIGTIVAIIVVWLGIAMGGNFEVFIEPHAALIVFGGMAASTFISFPLSTVLKVMTICKQCMVTKPLDPADEVRRFVDYARIARRSGILSLEEKLAESGNPFMRRGLQLVIDGTPAEAVREILTSQLDARRERHKRGKMVLDNMGASAPAMAMVGTLIGLIQMLANLSDPSGVGKGMAVALVATFYGAAFANLVAIPLANKLDARSQDENLMTQLMIEGIIGIQSGDNPRMIEDRLKSYLAPSVAQTLEENAEGKAA